MTAEDGERGAAVSLREMCQNPFIMSGQKQLSCCMTASKCSSLL